MIGLSLDELASVSTVRYRIVDGFGDRGEDLGGAADGVDILHVDAGLEDRAVLVFCWRISSCIFCAQGDIAGARVELPDGLGDLHLAGMGLDPMQILIEGIVDAAEDLDGKGRGDAGDTEAAFWRRRGRRRPMAVIALVPFISAIPSLKLRRSGVKPGSAKGLRVPRRLAPVDRPCLHR